MKKTNKVVTANYRDRKSNLKWLIREEDQHVDRAVPFTSVIAKGVKFEPSNQNEFGFGCTVVAICQTAEGHYKPLQDFDISKLTRLRFNWNSFENAETGEDISEVAVLYLDADGHMWADVSGADPGVNVSNEQTAVETA